MYIHTSYGIAKAIHLSLLPITSPVVKGATTCLFEFLVIIGIRTLSKFIFVNSLFLPSLKDSVHEALNNRVLTIRKAVSGDTVSERYTYVNNRLSA